MGEIWFITGTDTGVGKTVLTALLLASLQRAGRKPRALKPFCSGGRGDVNLLRGLQGGSVSRTDINPFYFPEPLTPLVAARNQNARVSLAEALEKITKAAERSEILLVEGAGGLLSPLGEDFSALEIIRELNCRTLVVASNRLGVLNRVLLVESVLKSAGQTGALFVLMGAARPDLSVRSNASILREKLGEARVVEAPYFGPKIKSAAAVRRIAAQPPVFAEISAWLQTLLKQVG